MNKKDITDAYVLIRKANNTISDEVLDFMKQSAIEKIDEAEINSTLKNPPQEFFSSMETFEKTIKLLKELKVNKSQKIFSIGFMRESLKDMSDEEIYYLMEQLTTFGFLKKEKGGLSIVENPVLRIESCNENINQMNKIVENAKATIKGIYLVIKYKHLKSIPFKA